MYIFSKTTLLKTMYEMNDLIAMVPLIDTIKHYLNRHLDIKLPYKDSIFMFLNYLNTLSTVKKKNGRGALRLKDRLKDSKQFFQKRWITGKAEEFLS